MSFEYSQNTQANLLLVDVYIYITNIILGKTPQTSLYKVINKRIAVYYRKLQNYLKQIHKKEKVAKIFTESLKKIVKWRVQCRNDKFVM